ncbi:MAG TPA: S8 family serine peptidase [Syntrophomonadaceae bacterium]|nr:S8 family serine peptidase [Syntrophomonadaceae bacterium]
MKIIQPAIKGIYGHTLSNIPWAPPGVSLIGAQRMWPTSKGGNVIVAVVDTGIDYTHPDLEENIIGGASFIVGDRDFKDENGHGTHVAGIIAAQGAILGVAPEAKLLGVKVLNKSGVGSISSIIQGLAWARKWRGENGEKVNVINMSLGSPLSNTKLHQEIKKAVLDGITVVCAAGNEGDGNPDTVEISYPAYYQETIAVGAINLQTGIADFSNSNDRIDVVAPGVDTYSTYPGGRYVELSGTSMASPHIAGAVALVYARYLLKFSSSPSPEDVKRLLHYQAINLGTIGFASLYGYGLFTFTIDGGKAIKLIVGENNYYINDETYYLNTPPFVKEGIVVADIGDICNLLNTNTLLLPIDDKEKNPGQILIWY